MGETQETKKKDKSQSNTVFVGSKTIREYIYSAMVCIAKNRPTNGTAMELKIVGRGKNISKVVAIAEILTKKEFEGTLRYKEVRCDSEGFIGKDLKPKVASILEISLLKEN